jgi:uncharacterized protein YndB with AHSA1/START domain
MSFQAYLDNIKAKTGKTSADFIKLATEKGMFDNPNLKPKVIIDWLKADFDLGHGHSMAIVAVFKQKGLIDSSKNKKADSRITKCEVTVLVNAPIDAVWACWNNPDDILKWARASEDWTLKHATNELEVGKQFNYGMAAKDGSAGFDFIGTYTKIIKNELIEYRIIGDDKRKVKVIFETKGKKTKVTELFDPETINPIEMQLKGWQAILDNFKKVCEKKVA